MIVLFSSGDGHRHSQRQTLHMCVCQEFLYKIEGTNMLLCRECGETRWLV